jgi:SAM-dependent methyltransferase
MNHDKEIQKNSYFKCRQIDESYYADYKLSTWIKNEISKDMYILDYGCGFGQNLYSLIQSGFHNSFGVDIEKQAIESCKANNLNVKELNLDDLKNPYDFRFDAIILSHVIEHIPKKEIISTLAYIKKEFLKEGGILLIAVPNAQSNTDCYWAYEDWTHTTLFTSGSLYYVLKSAGFNNVEFLDIDCTLDNTKIKKFIRKLFLKIYIFNKSFWNKITCSYYHQPSIQIFSYEIKVKAS